MLTTCGVWGGYSYEERSNGNPSSSVVGLRRVLSITVRYRPLCEGWSPENLERTIYYARG